MSGRRAKLLNKRHRAYRIVTPIGKRQYRMYKAYNGNVTLVLFPPK
jgi:hypothetical protein